jgi:hypothetical protein
MKEVKSSHRGKREILLQKRAVGFTLTPSESMKVVKSKIYESLNPKIHESMKAMKSNIATKFSKPINQ